MGKRCRRALEHKSQKGAGFIWGLLTGVLLVLFVAVLGYGVGKSATVKDDGAQKEVADTTLDITLTGESDIITQDFLQKIVTIEKFISDKYYLEEVDAATLQEGAYEGIVDALGDVYSVYYTAEEAAEVFAETEGIYYGIGAYVEMDTLTGYVKVSSVIKGTPAEEAGLMSDDIFYMIDGEDLTGLDTTQVVARVKGEEGTNVHLTMVRDGELIEVDVKRRKIESPTVQHSVLEEGIGYVQITEFDDVTINQFQEALKDIEKSGAEGMILDLRANPGGSLYAVLEIADMLLEEGLILYTEDKDGKREEYFSDARCKWDKPIVLLVDGNSASASELLSGALKDHGKATLVGTTTYGKGIVQTIRMLEDGSAVKLTRSAYFTPNGTNIHGKGIEPDVVVEFDGEAYYGEQQFDNQLDKAKEVLREKLLK